jgi:hypothetical protein
MSYRACWDDYGVRFEFYDVLTAQDLMGSSKELVEDPRFENIAYELGNFHNVKSVEVSSTTVRHMAKIDLAASKRNPNLKIALVVDSMLMLSLTRMWELSGGGKIWEARIFDNEEAAKLWIGLENFLD